MKSFLPNIIKNKQGFTLIEAMMVVALLGIFFTILYGAVNMNFDFLNRSNNQQEARHGAMIALSRIVDEIKQYENVEYVDSHTVEVDSGQQLNIEDLIQDMNNIKTAKFNRVQDSDVIIIKIETVTGEIYDSAVREDSSYIP